MGWVRDLVETAELETGRNNKLKIGKTVRYTDGRLVKIISGRYWGQYGISNFWSWQEVKADGSLGVIENGHGWM